MGLLERLLLLLAWVPGGQTFECDYSRRGVLEQLLASDRSGSFDTDLFLWPDHTVSYMFEDSVIEEDRVVIEQMMERVEDNTCLTFQQTGSRKRKTLVIRTEGSYSYCLPCYWLGIMCPTRNGGTVRTDPFCNKDFYCPYVFQGTTTMLLKFNFPFCGRLSDTFEGLVLHELFHALGLVHTQARPDRNDYIKVNMESIASAHRSQYGPICHDCHTFGLPYECDSVMHYGYKDFAKIGRTLAWFAPTMTPVDISCSLTADGGRRPTRVDWEIVNRAQNCPARERPKGLVDLIREALQAIEVP